MRRIRIAVVDSHEVVRVGLRLSLGAEPDMQVVGEAASGAGAVALARAERPDVMLLRADLGATDMDGLEACEGVLDASPRTAVLMLVADRQDAVVRHTREAGAAGHVTTDVALDDIKRMVRAVHRSGAGPGSPSAGGPAALAGSERRHPGAAAATDRLSATDLAIIRLLTEGLSNKAIAARVQRSPYTVKDHLRKIGAVLAVHSRTEIVAQALRRGIV